MNKKYVSLGIGIVVVLVIAIVMFSGNNENTTGDAISDNPASSELAGDPDKVTVYFFWGNNCPHCAEEKPFLEDLEQEYGDDLELKMFETYSDQGNQQLFQEAAQAYGIQAQGVPTTFIGEKHWVGFSNKMAPEMENYIQDCIENECESPLDA